MAQTNLTRLHKISITCPPTIMEDIMEKNENNNNKMNDDRPQNSSTSLLTVSGNTYLSPQVRNTPTKGHFYYAVHSFPYHGALKFNAKTMV